LEVVLLSTQPVPDTVASPTLSLDARQKQFLEIMPRIETHARIHFRHLHCPGKRDDAIQECLAVAWRWFLRASQKGKEPSEFVSALATYAVRHVRSGRKLAGMNKSKDVHNPHAQQQHNFKVETLHHSTRRCWDSIYSAPNGQEDMDASEERLRDNTQSPVPEQAAFRIDYPAWLRQLGSRNRKVALDMVKDMRTKELAHKHGTSEGRISQLRRELHTDWRRFHGEPV
jgi:hypothetical protein